VGQDTYEQFGDLALSVGPTAILNAYQTRSTDEILDILDDFAVDWLPQVEYLFDPLSKIWGKRKTKPPPTDASHWKSILDVIHGEHDICHRCSAIHGFNLWNETNWEDLRGIESIAHRLLPSFLKGNLAFSVTEQALLREQIDDSGFTYKVLLQEIHSVRTSAFDGWDEQDWLCLGCINEIIQSHLHLWLLERKKNSGKQILEDCWYGYSCRTQTHSMHHAARLNHLCEPTR